MSFLTEEEIERLKKTHPIKKIFRFAFLIIGIFIIFIGILLVLIGIDFGITIDDVNISFIIDVLIIIFGIIITSKFFIAPYYLRENSLTIKKIHELREPTDIDLKFCSIALIRLGAAIIFLFVGVLTLLIFGTDVGHTVTYGSAVVLGGPSFFYVTGLPALGIGFGLFLYFILSPFRGRFSSSKNFYFFYELRPFCPWLTEVPKKDIEAIRYQNNHLGPKLGWVMLILPFIVLQFMTAIPLFFVERAGPEYVLSWIFLIISILEIFAIMLLVLLQQNYFEIATKTHLYEMWFSPFKLKRRKRIELRENFSNYFECGIEKRVESNPRFTNVNETQFQLFNLIFGLFLIISAIVMLTQMILFGPLYWWVALMYGIILIVKAFSFDFSKKGGDEFYYDETSKIFKFRRKFSFKFHNITAFNVEYVKVRKWFRKLDFFDIFGIGSIIVMLTIQQIEGWWLVNSLSVITDNIVSTIYLGIVFIFVILYVCLPIDAIEFKTPSIVYRIRITSKLNGKSLIHKYINDLREFPKEVLKEDLFKTFIQRLGIIIFLIIGSIFYSIYTLIAFIT
ncbi:MAG: hypothetical protein ACFFDY_04750 [Candidatus Thorarchaeota archaeon]